MTRFYRGWSPTTPPDDKRCQCSDGCLQYRMRDSEFSWQHTPGAMEAARAEAKAHLERDLELWRTASTIYPDISVLAMPFKSRTMNTLMRGGVITLRGLLVQSERELMQIRNMGTGGLAEILKVLSLRKLSLQGRPGPFLVQTDHGWWEPAHA